MDNWLLFAGAIPFAVLGVGHFLGAVGDLRKPRTFVPSDPALIPAMRAARVAATSRGPGGHDLWRTWLGANLTHSLGLGAFAALLIAQASSAGTPLSVRVLAIVFGAAYAVLALRFWFLPAALLATVGTVCFTLSVTIAP